MLNLKYFDCNISSWLHKAGSIYSNNVAFNEITYKQFYGIVEAHSEEIKEMTHGKTVAILADSNEQYALWSFTFFNLGVKFLNLSPSNSISITVDMIKNSGVDVLIYDKKYQSHAKQVEIQQPHIKLIEKYAINKVKERSNIIPKKIPSQDIVTIFHSSGSTSNPKFVYHSDRYYIKNCFRLINKIKLQENEKIGIMAPLYHAFGFKIMLLALLTGSEMNFTSKHTSKTKCTKLFTLPYHLEYADLSNFVGLEHIYFSGASLSREIQNKIIQNDKKLTAIYGSSETGLIATIHMNINSYLDFDPELAIDLIQYEGNIFEVCVQLDDAALSSNLKSDGIDQLYHSCDLVELQDGYYKLLGRKDDLLIHLNGEKTNALGVEDKLLFILGDLVENLCLINMPNTLFNILVLELSIKSYTIHSSKSILMLINDAVQIVNSEIPRHSAILWDLIYFLPKNSEKNIPFVKSKRNIQRNKCKMIFNEEMKFLYKNYI